MPFCQDDFASTLPNIRRFLKCFSRSRKHSVSLYKIHVHNLGNMTVDKFC